MVWEPCGLPACRRRAGRLDRAGLWYKMEHFQGCGHVFMQARPGNGCERCDQTVRECLLTIVDLRTRCNVLGNVRVLQPDATGLQTKKPGD